MDSDALAHLHKVPLRVRDRHSHAAAALPAAAPCDRSEAQCHPGREAFGPLHALQALRACPAQALAAAASAATSSSSSSTTTNASCSTSSASSSTASADAASASVAGN